MHCRQAVVASKNRIYLQRMVSLAFARSHIQTGAWCLCLLPVVQLSPGSHSTEAAVNKQLNDKERVLAALENPSLLEMVNRCLMGSAANGDVAPLAG
jgi:hypothetical protein